MQSDFQHKIFNISSIKEFKKLAIELFQHQAQQNNVYKKYIALRGLNPEKIEKIEEIPFLPISFFKTHQIVTGENPSIETTFESSGTTGMTSSKHHVHSLKIYEESFLKGFELMYGNPKEYAVLALLPSYLERGTSSLVYMANKLIQLSESPHSGFFLDEFDQLKNSLKILEKKQKKGILLGVSFALLDFAQLHALPLSSIEIMETGGMKGRKEEITREEMHHLLSKAFHKKNIHSEYGMTELLSQAYSKGKGVFSTPPWMKILIRDTYNPSAIMPNGKSGGINIIDLANIHSCAFIETMDLGKKLNDTEFSMLGRFDHSDMRGCNLLVQ